MGLGIPPLKIEILLESNPLKSRILVRRLAVQRVTNDERARNILRIHIFYISLSIYIYIKYIIRCMYIYIYKRSLQTIVFL